MEQRDVFEQVEQAETAAVQREHFSRRAAVVVSILAALLAISTLAGNNASTTAILAQQRASDTYNEYQANSLKRHVNENSASLLRTLAVADIGASDAVQRAEQLEADVASKYRPNQDRLLPEAQALEHDREGAEARHRAFELAEAGFQLAIALSSVAIVARSAPLLLTGSGLGLLGLGLLANGFLMLVPPPG